MRKKTYRDLISIYLPEIMIEFENTSIINNMGERQTI